MSGSLFYLTRNSSHQSWLWLGLALFAISSRVNANDGTAVSMPASPAFSRLDTGDELLVRKSIRGKLSSSDTSARVLILQSGQPIAKQDLGLQEPRCSIEIDTDKSGETAEKREHEKNRATFQNDLAKLSPRDSVAIKKALDGNPFFVKENAVAEIESWDESRRERFATELSSMYESKSDADFGIQGNLIGGIITLARNPGTKREHLKEFVEFLRGEITPLYPETRKRITRLRAEIQLLSRKIAELEQYIEIHPEFLKIISTAHKPDQSQYTWLVESRTFLESSARIRKITCESIRTDSDFHRVFDAENVLSTIEFLPVGTPSKSPSRKLASENTSGVIPEGW